MTWPLVHELVAKRGLPVVGGSDAHFPFEVGRAFTRVDADELTPAGVADAIRRGAVEPDVRSTRFGRLLEREYDVVRAVKGHRTADLHTPGIGEPPNEGENTTNGVQDSNDKSVTDGEPLTDGEPVTDGESVPTE